MTRRANPIDDIIADRRLLLRAWVNSRFGTQLLRTLIEAMSRGGFELHAARSLTQIVVGMARQSYDLQLKRYRQEGWRATFYPAGRGHSVTSTVGSAWEREPWTRCSGPRGRACGGGRHPSGFFTPNTAKGSDVYDPA